MHGDVITKVDTQTLDNADSLIAAIHAEAPGAKVTLTYQRNGSSETTTATLGSDQPTA